MAYLNSADLIRRAKIRLGRPSSDNAFTSSTTDDVIYDFATDAQTRVNTLLGIYAPDAIWTAPTELSSSDGGYTYTFGTDTDGDAIFAFGHYTLYENRESIPDFPLIDNVDYTVEGSKIRIPYNTTRTFTDGGPWAQYVAPTNVVTSTTQPVIPKIARVPMLTDIVRRGREYLGQDASGDEAEFQREWGDLLAQIRTQGWQKGGQTMVNRPRAFWRQRKWL